MHQSLRSQTQVSEIPSQACDSRHHDEDISLLHDSHNHPRIQQASWNSAEDECFQDIFDGLPNLHQLDNICSDNKLSPSTLDMRESPRRKTKSTNQDDEVVISESIRKKRTRSAEQNEVHNMSERKRRNKIKEKMNALQELIPNCNKSDKASMLDEAIEYMKVMKLQVHMISMAREAMWRTGCQGITNTPQMIPESSTPSMQMEFGMGMGFGIGMGMVNMCCYSEGKCRPFPQFQSTTTNPCSRLSSFSGPRSPVPFPQFQAAAPPSFMANSQVVPSDATASNSSSTVKPQLMTPKDFPFSPSTSQFSRDTNSNHNHEVPIQKPRQ